MPSPLDQLLEAYGDPVKTWPDESDAWDRDLILPFARRSVPQPVTGPQDWQSSADVMKSLDARQGNRWQFAVPQIAKDAGDAVSTVGSAPIGNPVHIPSRMTEDDMTRMLDTAGAIVGPMAAAGFARAGLGAPGSELGIFGGRMAKTANHEKLALAEKMAADGVPREQIWNDTGWFQGVDGKWRFEIDDSKSSFSLRDLDAIEPLGRHLGHDDAFSAYPSMADVPTRRQAMGPSYFDGKSFNLGQKPFDDFGTKSTALHEAQHFVQKAEDFGRGGDLDIARKLEFPTRQLEESQKNAMAALNLAARSGNTDDVVKNVGYLAEINKKIDAQMSKQRSISDDSAFDVYRRIAGEVEARAVQSRRDLTPDQRASRPPWLDYDVPESQQIVRFGDSGPQMSVENDP